MHHYAVGAACEFVCSPLDLVTTDLPGVLCLKPSRCTDAVATGLTAFRLRSCAPDLQPLNRAFQRFDLFLTGTEGLSAEDVAAVLSTRTDLSGAKVEKVTPLSPLCIEQGLPMPPSFSVALIVPPSV